MAGQNSMLVKGQWSAVAVRHHVYKHVPTHFPCAHCHGGTLSPRLTRFQRVSVRRNFDLTRVALIRHGQQMRVRAFAFERRVITQCLSNVGVQQYRRAGQLSGSTLHMYQGGAWFECRRDTYNPARIFMVSLRSSRCLPVYQFFQFSTISFQEISSF